MMISKRIHFEDDGDGDDGGGGEEEEEEEEPEFLSTEVSDLPSSLARCWIDSSHVQHDNVRVRLGYADNIN